VASIKKGKKSAYDIHESCPMLDARSATIIEIRELRSTQQLCCLE
jgi:hypothetical protein